MNDSMNEVMNQPMDRGNRLQPSRWHRLYWHLTCLRRAVEQVIDEHIYHNNYQRLIDFGCGNSPYRSLFAPHVKRYDSADLAGNQLATITINEDGTVPAENGSVDVVLSSQVLEHVGDPHIYLQECHRILNDRGVLVLSTHGVWRYHPDPTDYWRWTSAGIRLIIARHGFEVVDVKAIMGPAATSIQLFQDATARYCPKFMRPLYFLPLQLLMQIFDRLCAEQSRDQDAAVYLVVARRQRS